MPLTNVESKSALRLFAVSLLLLFSEVMFIRWLGVELPIMRVFPALTLTTIFIGTSAGLSTYTKPLPQTPVLGFAILSILIFLIAATYLPLNELTLSDSKMIPVSLLVLGLIVVNLTMTFLSLGRSMGTEFDKLPALKAYAVNLAGSLTGVVFFAVISWLGLPPAAWLAICGALTFFLTGKKYVAIISVVLVAAAAFINPPGTVWSAYGKMRTVPSQLVVKGEPNDGSYRLLLNGDFFHGGTNIQPVSSLKEISEKYRQSSQWGRAYRFWLEIPFFVATKFDKILVLGAGSGNDVVCALQHGAKHVDAVERDAHIAKRGKELHPNKPYDDPRVQVHVADARTFLRYSKDKYDLIQFAYLDPGVTLKLSSFLRSDNFVYTEESIKSALDRLSDNGIVSLSFATDGDSPVTRRLYKNIIDAYGKPPLALVQDYTGSCFFLFGPGLKENALPTEIYELGGLRSWPGQGEYTDTKTATDDWPFLYLEFNYGSAFLYFCVITAAAVLPLAVLAKEGLSGKPKFSEVGPMFLLGLAFMLIETKSITQLSLLYGATWIVSSVVIFVILLLACISNFVVDRLKLKDLRPGYIGLIATLVLDYFWRVPEHSDLQPMVLAALSATVACLPVFFGGFIFSILLSRSSNPVMSLSANVIGVAFGGLLEHICMATGIRSMSILALAIYLSSALPLIGAKKDPSSPTPAPPEPPPAPPAEEPAGG